MRLAMASTVLINLTCGQDEGERVVLAFLTGEAALRAGHRVAVMLAHDAVRLALPGHVATLRPTRGAPPVERILRQYTDGGGELLVCRTSWKSRVLSAESMVEHARLTGGTALWDWLGDRAMVLNY
jgi:predicted peroxiredoxin